VRGAGTGQGPGLRKNWPGKKSENVVREEKVGEREEKVPSKEEKVPLEHNNMMVEVVDMICYNIVTMNKGIQLWA